MRVFISSLYNSFLGTLTFTGDKVSCKKDLQDLMQQYATFERHGKRYWKGIVCINFIEELTVNSFTKNNTIKQDSLNNVFILFNPGYWLDEKNIKFSWCIKNADDILIPIYGKLEDALKYLNITLL